MNKNILVGVGKTNVRLSKYPGMSKQHLRPYLALSVGYDVTNTLGILNTVLWELENNILEGLGKILPPDWG